MVLKRIFPEYFQCFSSVTLLYTAHYVRREEVIFNSLLHIAEDGVQKFCTPYWKFRKTKCINTAICSANYWKWRGIILYFVLDIMKFRIPFMQYCNEKNGSTNFIYEVLYSNKGKGTCSNIVPCYARFRILHLFPITRFSMLRSEDFYQNNWNVFNL